MTSITITKLDFYKNLLIILTKSSKLVFSDLVIDGPQETKSSGSLLSILSSSWGCESIQDKARKTQLPLLAPTCKNTNKVFEIYRYVLPNDCSQRDLSWSPVAISKHLRNRR